MAATLTAAITSRSVKPPVGLKSALTAMTATHCWPSRRESCVGLPWHAQGLNSRQQNNKERRGELALHQITSSFPKLGSLLPIETDVTLRVGICLHQFDLMRPGAALSFLSQCLLRRSCIHSTHFCVLCIHDSRAYTRGRQGRPGTGGSEWPDGPLGCGTGYTVADGVIPSFCRQRCV